VTANQSKVSIKGYFRQNEPVYIQDISDIHPEYTGFYTTTQPAVTSGIYYTMNIYPLGSNGIRTTTDPMSSYAGNVAVFNYQNAGSSMSWVRQGYMLADFAGYSEASLSFSDDGLRLLASVKRYGMLISYVFKSPSLLSSYALTNILALIDPYPIDNAGIFGISGDGKMAMLDYALYYLDSLPIPDYITATPSAVLKNITYNGVEDFARNANYLAKGAPQKYQIISDQSSNGAKKNTTFSYALGYGGEPVPDESYISPSSALDYSAMFIGDDKAVSKNGDVLVRSYKDGGVRSILFHQSDKQIITAPAGMVWFGNQVEMNPDGTFFTCVYGKRSDTDKSISYGKCTYVRMGQRFYNQLENRIIYNNFPAAVYPLTNLALPTTYVTDSKCIQQITNVYGTDANLLGIFRDLDEGVSKRTTTSWNKNWLTNNADRSLLFTSNTTGTNGPVTGKNSVAISEDGVSFVVGSLFSNNGTGAIELYTRDVAQDGTFYSAWSAGTSVFKGADFLSVTVDKANLKYPLFGYSVTILGTVGNRWIAVGAPKAYDGKGVVWIWRVDERDQTTPDTYILMGENANEGFGTAVKIYINPDTTYMTLAVGTDTGLVKMYAKTGTSTTPFEPTGIIVAPDGKDSGFGKDIKTTRDGLQNIIITAPLAPYQGTKLQAGVIYVYSSDGTTLLKTYRSESPQANDQTGFRASDRFYTNTGAVGYGFRTITAIGSPGRNNGNGQIEITFENPYP